MAKGKVIRFDDVRGYGFIAPDSGGDDVFIHVNDLGFDKRLLGQGVQVEFDVEAGERGPKASRVSMVNRSVERPSTPAVRSPSQRSSEDDSMCDVLSVKELLDEVTENLLEVTPSITAEQILHIRQRMAQIAHTHGWVDA